MIDALPSLAAMPKDLTELPQWVCWRGKLVDGRTTKVPYTTTGRLASTTDSRTWTDPESAMRVAERGEADGIGFVFTENDPFVGIDLDHAIEDNTLAPWAQDILDDLHSYAELSPSGTGVHIIVRGKLPGRGLHTLRVEMYDQGRYFTMTGRRLNEYPVADCNGQLAKLYESLKPTPQPIAMGVGIPGTSSLDEQAVIDRASEANDGAKFARLFAGDTAGYASASEATAALLHLLAFWTDRDPAMMDRLFRKSGLMRDKWDTMRGKQTWGQQEIASAIARCPDGYQPSGRVIVSGSRADTPLTPKADWPAPPAAAAYHGFVGEYIRRLAPHTEADPAAILVQALVGIGNRIGPGPFFEIDKTYHRTDLFCCVVGDTSEGRKGTGYGHARRLFCLGDDEWGKEHITSGLSSGEGLIWAVRDPQKPHDAPKAKGGKEVELDPGVTDKRLLVFEAEMSSVLNVMGRAGNTLSAVVRNAWDGNILSTMVKNSPAKASNTHISLIGHITPEELRRDLTSTDMANGFANRFLWVASKSINILPHGGEDISTAEFELRLLDALDVASGVSEMERDAEANLYWGDEDTKIGLYYNLRQPRKGLYAAITNRAAPQIMRLACIYALLDRSPIVRLIHLQAAEALWDYCDRTAQYLFGGSLGDATADQIAVALRGSKGGMTRTEINRLFGSHKTQAEVERGLDVLLTMGLATRERVETEGRPKEVWYAVE